MHVGRNTDMSTSSWFLFCRLAQVRQQLKADNYKAGRISQLLKATRPNPEQQTTTEVVDSGMDVTGLPRLFGKQAPAGGWEDVAMPPWVQRVLVASTAETPVRGRESAEYVCGFFFETRKANH